jgi:hypothetical protein
LTKGVIVPNAVVADLGKGESAVLALALESTSPLVILDDALGRRAAELLGTPPSRNAAISRRKYPALRFMIVSSCARRMDTGSPTALRAMPKAAAAAGGVDRAIKLGIFQPRMDAKERE